MTKIQHLTSKSDAEKINKYIDDGKHLFVLVYMNGCGPCNATKPHWIGMQMHPKLSEVLSKGNGNVEIAYVERENQDVFKDKLNSIDGYPSIQYVHRGKKVNYNGERTEDGFLSWMLQMLDDAGPISAAASTSSSAASRGRSRGRSIGRNRSRGRSGGSGLGCTACSGSSGVGVVDGVGSGLFSGGRRRRHRRHRTTRRRHRRYHSRRTRRHYRNKK